MFKVQLFLYKQIYTKCSTDLDYKILSILSEKCTQQDLHNLITKIFEQGLESGILHNLIYFQDIVDFYQKYKKEINQILAITCEKTGLKVQEIFGSKWEEEDPLALDVWNQTLLVWFGFEEGLRNLIQKTNILKLKQIIQ